MNRATPRPGCGPPAITPAAGYTGVFRATADQVSLVRLAVGRYLGGCPAKDDAVLVASELAANAILHSRSGHGFFTVRCEVFADYAWVEVEDLGGPWITRQLEDRPHGLDVVAAVACDGNWTSSRSPAGAGSPGHGWNGEAPHDHDRHRQVRRRLPRGRLEHVRLRAGPVQAGRRRTLAAVSAGQADRARA